MRFQANKIFVVLLWGIVFALAYAQSPLYTSNQNQYFLHGLAQAGYGYLDKDWLANTSDPTPVFSQLVALVYRQVRWEGLFYFIYAGLMGIYFYSLWGIAAKIYDLRASPTKRLLFLALIVTLHAAGLRFVLSRLVGVNWTYIFEDGLADQRLLGPVLQPSAFGVFLLLSVYLYLKRRLVLAVLAAVLAATFHPTYLLSAATLIAAYLLSTAYEERSLKKPLVLGVLALITVAPNLLASFPVFVAAPAASLEQARQVLVEYRIPHHAKVSWWFDATAVVKLLLIFLTLYLVRRTRLFLVLLLCACVAGGFTLLQIVLESHALALLFPWRMSVFLLPLSTALLLAYLVDLILDLPGLDTPKAKKIVTGLSFGLVLLSVFAGVVRFALDLQRKAGEPERRVQAYVSTNGNDGDVYLIPLKMQDFRLAAGAPAFVDFKSIPYRADEVLEWYRRMQLVDRFYRSRDCAVLDQLLEMYSLTNVITETGNGSPVCPRLELAYSDEAYSLWHLR